VAAEAGKHITLEGQEDDWIDNTDQVYGRLLLWRDSNHDGMSQSAEISTLSQAGVQRISLEITESQRPRSIW
jgi:hypothetical protein